MKVLAALIITSAITMGAAQTAFAANTLSFDTPAMTSDGTELAATKKKPKLRDKEKIFDDFVRDSTVTFDEHPNIN